MSFRVQLVAVVLGVITTLGCQDRRSQPLSPTAVDGSNTTATGAGSPQLAAAGGVRERERVIALFDACDPDSFNAAVGAGACVRPGGMKFATFIDLLTRHQSVEAWHFAPGHATLRVGDTLTAVNRGGEEHTFTEVDDFGGGVVPQLNQLAGLTTVAPECSQLPANARLAPGASSSEVENDEGVEKYQCCIHPWMRAEIRIVAK